MKLLLDTHVFLWFMFGKNLSQEAQEAFLNIDNYLHLSAVSYWKICIKHSLGKLNFAENWVKLFDRKIMINGCQLRKNTVRELLIYQRFIVIHLIGYPLHKHKSKV